MPFRVLICLLMLGALLALPFYLRREEKLPPPAPDADVVVVISAHNKSVRDEYERAFRRYYRDRFELAAVHDAGRPMLTPELLLACLDAARIHGGAMACRKVAETVKRITPDGFLGETVPRDELRTAETPQVFRFKALLEAYRLAAASDELFTDDAQVMERFAPVRVFPVEHDFPNPKITYRPDLELCRTLLKLRREGSGS